MLGARRQLVTAAPAEPGPNALGQALGLLGDEWSLLVVQQLLLGRTRFVELQRALGAAPATLSSRLSSLADGGVVEKRPDGYALTRSGAQLWRVLLCLWAWEQRWVQGDALPTMRHLACGAVFAPALSCAACGAHTALPDLDLSLGPAGALSRAVPVGTHRKRSGTAAGEGPGLFPDTVALLGSRWSAGVVGCLLLGATRFREVERMLGAPPTVVSARLRELVARGVLRRDGTAYALTDKGRDVLPAVASLVAWGERWLGAPDGPSLVVTHRECGAAFVPVLVCDRCDGALVRREVAVETATSAHP